MTIRKVISRSIALDVIVAEDIAANAVTAAEISNGAVTTNKIADAAITTAKIAENAVVTADIADSAVSISKVGTSVSQLFGLRNKVINGDFGIWQRGTSFAPTSVLYGADRFAAYKAGAAAGDYARSTDVPAGEGFTFSALLNNADLRHAIELPGAGFGGEFTSGSTWTVSFWIKLQAGSANGTVGLGFADGVGAGNYGRWGADQSFTATTTWQRITRTFTVSTAAAGSNTCVLLYIGALAGQLITGIQVERGSVATPFERRPFHTELALCQRYYQIQYWYEFTSVNATIPFCTTMRAAPTATFSNPGWGTNVNNVFGSFPSALFVSAPSVVWSAEARLSAEL